MKRMIECRLARHCTILIAMLMVFVDPGGLAEQASAQAWEPGPAAEPVAAATLTLHTSQCPPGIDPDSDLYEPCHDFGLAGVEITLRAPNHALLGEQTSWIQSDPGPGVVSWSGLDPANYAIELAGYNPADVFVPICTQIDAGIPASFTMHPSQTAIVLDLPANTNVVCDFYFVPRSENGTSLQLSVYDCPEFPKPTEDTPLSEFQQRCAPSQGTSWYTLTRSGQDSITLVPANFPSGTAVFPGLSTGAYQLVTSIPGHDNDAWVFCGAAGGELVLVGANATISSLAIDAGQGPYACSWYNVPETFRD